MSRTSQLLISRATAADIDELIAAVNDIYDTIALDDPDGDDFQVADYLTDEAQQFAAGRAVDGGALPRNGATATALAGAVATLEEFHATELRPLPRQRLRGW
jgi:hypothetical protein